MRQTEFLATACDPKTLTVGQLMQDAVFTCGSRAIEQAQKSCASVHSGSAYTADRYNKWLGCTMNSSQDTAPGRTECSRHVMQILKAGALYFALVFGAGFVLGSIRVQWVIPRFGERTAELMEMPIMLVVIIVAAQWVTRRLALLTSPVTRLGVGCVALGFLLVTEFTFVLSLRGLTIGEYFASRDPVAGTVYVVMLGVFALMPLLVVRQRDR